MYKYNILQGYKAQTLTLTKTRLVNHNIEISSYENIQNTKQNLLKHGLHLYSSLSHIPFDWQRNSSDV